MFQSAVVGILALFAAAAVAQKPPGRCPEDYGVQTYPNEYACDRFYKVRKGIKWMKRRSRLRKELNLLHLKSCGGSNISD